MAVKAPYHTRQQEELLRYLRATPGQHHTAAQIREHFVGQQHSVGLATIYRQLERFVAEGTVRKYMLETGDSACYEYVGEDADCATHFHCKCERCGRLIHMDCHELQEVQAHLLEHHGFLWNSGKTVFYGVCEACRNA